MVYIVYIIYTVYTVCIIYTVYTVYIFYYKFIAKYTVCCKLIIRYIVYYNLLADTMGLL
jgi:hypothetical protein